MKVERTLLKNWAIQNLVDSKAIVVRPELEKPVTFTSTGIKEAINQPHKHYDAKNESIFQIIELIQSGTYIKSEKDTKKRFKCFHYLEVEIKNEKSWVVLREKFDGTIDFYTIVDFLK